MPSLISKLRKAAWPSTKKMTFELKRFAALDRKDDSEETRQPALGFMHLDTIVSFFIHNCTPCWYDSSIPADNLWLLKLFKSHSDVRRARCESERCRAFVWWWLSDSEKGSRGGGWAMEKKGGGDGRREVLYSMIQ